MTGGIRWAEDQAKQEGHQDRPGGVSASKDISRVNKAGFKNMGGGRWQMSVDGVGGASILDESGIVTSYSVEVWNGNYDFISRGDSFSSLNMAKSFARDQLSNDIRKRQY